MDQRFLVLKIGSLVQSPPIFQLYLMPYNGVVPGLPLEGKVFAITGGASGIGLAAAKSLCQKGAIVCVADVDQAALDSAGSFFASQKRSFKTSKVDVSRRSDVEAWIGSIVSEFGRLDGAANVAGIIGKGHGRDAVTALDDDEWDRIIAVNLTGMMYCLRAELNRVVDGGSIVNVASIHGTKGNVSSGLYFPHFLASHGPVPTHVQMLILWPPPQGSHVMLHTMLASTVC